MGGLQHDYSCRCHKNDHCGASIASILITIGKRVNSIEVHYDSYIVASQKPLSSKFILLSLRIFNCFMHSHSTVRLDGVYV